MRTCTVWIRGLVAAGLFVAGLLPAACGDSGGGSGKDGGGPGDPDGSGNPDGAGEGGSGEDRCDVPFASLSLRSTLTDIAGEAFDRPVFVTQAPGSTDTLWVVEKRGVIKLVRGGEVLDTPFLDIASDVDYLPSEDDKNDERGMLGLAFHPDYEDNGRFFVFYNDADNDFTTVVGEFSVSGNPDVANGTEVARPLEIDDGGGRNHVGGMLAFGPDGYLYVAVGDGGGSGDNHGEFGNALNKDVPLGKILRLDVDNAAEDYVAAGNPFEDGGGHPLVWHYGLRNPWRFSFDRGDGAMWIGDVGQDEWEEIDWVPAGEGGHNFGWRAFEGEATYDDDPDTQALAVGRTPPVYVFPHEDESHPYLPNARSVTGGYADEQGVYYFSDITSDTIVAYRNCPGGPEDITVAVDLAAEGSASSVVSFGEDNAGELYVVSYGDERVYKFE